MVNLYAFGTIVGYVHNAVHTIRRSITARRIQHLVYMEHIKGIVIEDRSYTTKERTQEGELLKSCLPQHCEQVTHHFFHFRGRG